MIVRATSNLFAAAAVPSETACPHAVKSTDETKNGLWAGRLQNSA